MARIAILSTAHIHTKQFVENILKATDGRKAVLVWDDVADRGKRYAEMAQARFEPELGKALAAADVDAFLICAENTRHLSLLEKVLPLKKPVFCEKPIATHTGDLAAIAKLARKTGTPLSSGYFQPFSGTMLAAAKLVQAGDLGKITRVKFRNAHNAAYGRWFDNPDLAWFTQPKLSGGGAFLDMGTHAVHLLRTLFGPVECVWAEIGNHSGVYPACDDFGIAHFRFASGVLGTVEAAWTQTGGIGGLEITGASATLFNNGKEYVIGAPRVDPKPLEALPAKPDRMDRLVALTRGEVPEAEWKADLDACFDAVAIVEAAYESSKKGKWVKVRSV
ncbi:MAG: Gfo/Idh/MocA family oxidoreductase [Spirochaetes bacterium]|nr:Gfo/Idh/MocA family oxidoreductase [Spirochaetota bacterium]